MQQNTMQKPHAAMLPRGAPRPIMGAFPQAYRPVESIPSVTFRASPTENRIEESRIDFSFLSEHSDISKLARGEIFIRENTPAEYFYLITKGTAMLFRSLPNGRRQVTHFSSAGDLVGMSDLNTLSYTAKAVGEVWLCRFPRSYLEGFCERFSGLTTLLLKSALYELSLSHEHLLLLGRKTARERIASFLTSCVSNKRSDYPFTPLRAQVALPMSRMDIADFLGLRCETVSRILARFKEEDVIAATTSGEIVIRNLATLKMYAAGACAAPGTALA